VAGRCWQAHAQGPSRTSNCHLPVLRKFACHDCFPRRKTCKYTSTQKTHKTYSATLNTALKTMIWPLSPEECKIEFEFIIHLWNIWLCLYYSWKKWDTEIHPSVLPCARYAIVFLWWILFVKSFEMAAIDHERSKLTTQCHKTMATCFYHRAVYPVTPLDPIFVVTFKCNEWLSHDLKQ
jgi:hypothetical protein